jgi:hypothetical protein
MHDAWFNQLEVLMAEYKLEHVAASVKCVRFEKEGLSVETCNRGETFEIRHSRTIHISTGLADLANIWRISSPLSNSVGGLRACTPSDVPRDGRLLCVPMTSFERGSSRLRQFRGIVTPGKFYKGRSQEKTRVQQLKFFLLRSHLRKQDLF